MSLPYENSNITPSGINRRNFFWKGSALALLSAIPGFAKAAGTPAPVVPAPTCSPASAAAIQLALAKIYNSPDNRTVTAGLATILSSPEMISLPAYCIPSTTALRRK